ncbi:MAG TPA: beta-galactosidase [Humisphaera sp.]|jgi:beta-galactosidase|nr:beta-galactosidase [Humisphaera sp.]
MQIGTYYYPEQWPREQWERDFDNIARRGLQIVHMGEFAWHSMEPRAGEIQLDWLATCVEMAQKRKLAVMLCTPTAAPPIWLIEQHPEILPIDANGQRARFGGRRHYSPLAPAMREATARIVGALADRFGDHPAVIGWQIDNEYSGAFDQSDQAHQAFAQWLRERYKNIDALNRAWGCQFWNTYYSDFSQIRLPASRDPKYGNPHQCLDASRFWSAAFASFNKLQADILRPKIGSRFITTNFMPFQLDCNPADMAGDLSLMSWDAYPVAGLEKNPGSEHFRLGDPSSICFTHDHMASFSGRWGQMELQPGHINWSGFPVLPYPGAIRLWLWTAFAHGAEFAMTYRFRQPRFGIEMFHDGLTGPDGVSPSIGGREFETTIAELKQLDLSKSPPIKDEYDPQSTVGLLFDFEQLWYFKTLPHAKRWDQAAWLTSWYGAICRAGLRVKLLRPDSQWPADLKMIVAPSVQMVDGVLIERWQNYVQAGGHLVLTCRSALMDRQGQLFEGPLASPIKDLIGGAIEAYDCLPEGKFGEVEMDGKRFPWGTWGDILYAGEDAKVLAKYADQFYAGAAAVIRRSHGAGQVTYCGVHAERPFVEALVEKLATGAKLATTSLPWRVHLLRRGPYQILLNYNDHPVDAPAKRGAELLIGTRKVPPAGVAVWM